MTVANHQQAIDETYALVATAWNDAQTLLSVAYKPEMRYDGKETNPKPGADKYWARSSVKLAEEGQATLSNCVSEQTKRRYKKEALLFIQVFAPKNGNNAQVKGLNLSEMLKNALRGKYTTPGAVTFYNCRVVNLEANNESLRWNVIAEMQFDEIG